MIKKILQDIDNLLQKNKNIEKKKSVKSGQEKFESRVSIKSYEKNKNHEVKVAFES